MMKSALVAAAALALGGCATYGNPYSGVGVSVGYGSGYGGYGGSYGGYGGYGSQYGYNNGCITYDRYGRAYNACGNAGNYGYGSYGAYGYPRRVVVYNYPGYTYRGGYYYDNYGRRYDVRTMNRRHGRGHVYRGRRGY
jgi:hypothetical protein